MRRRLNDFVDNVKLGLKKSIIEMTPPQTHTQTYVSGVFIGHLIVYTHPVNDKVSFINAKGEE